MSANDDWVPPELRRLEGVRREKPVPPPAIAQALEAEVDALIVYELAGSSWQLRLFAELGLAAVRRDEARERFTARVVASLRQGSADGEQPVWKAREWEEYLALDRAENALRRLRHNVACAAMSWVGGHLHVKAQAAAEPEQVTK